jgi:hypothetical protein
LYYLFQIFNFKKAWTQECVEFAKLCTSECSFFVFKRGGTFPFYKVANI